LGIPVKELVQDLLIKANPETSSGRYLTIHFNGGLAVRQKLEQYPHVICGEDDTYCRVLTARIPI